MILQVTPIIIIVLKKLNIEEKGKIQELLIKCYFHVYWKLYDVKYYYARVCDTLPDEYLKRDLGTDGYILHSDDKISLVQVKYRSNTNSTMHRSYLGNITLEAVKYIYYFNKYKVFSYKIKRVCKVDC